MGNEISIQMTNIGKQYTLGEFGGHTFQEAWREYWNSRLPGRHDGRSASDEQGRRFYALQGIDLSVRRGETLGIIGHNGAGKSTLLKLISRITLPSEGRIELNGRVSSLLEVGTGFHPELTGRENIYLNGAILGMRKSEIDSKIDDIIAFSETEQFIDTPVKRYSSGMYVKLAFAVAAHLDSEILIMDEILAVGDMSFQKKCLKKMREAAREKGCTVLYVSHNMSTIRSLCDRCIVLDHGRKIFDGDVAKAISIYLGTEAAEKVRFEYDAGYRPYDQYLRTNLRLEMDAMTLESRKEPVFSSEEPQHLKLECTAFKNLPRVCFRFELWAEDGTKIGTMLSGNAVDLREGKNTVEITFDPAHLCSGQYSADLVAYQYDEDGNEDILDGVYPGWMFQIRNPLDRKHYLDWHHRYWGYVRLNDLRLK